MVLTLVYKVNKAPLEGVWILAKGIEMAIGEAGSLYTSGVENQAITVTFTEPLTDPIIVMTGTQNGGHPYTFRIVDQTIDADGNTTSFSFIIEEWEYLDGDHPVAEDINWLAIEEGVHTLSDGRIIEAGMTDADDGVTSVDLNGDFENPPVVMTSVMSNNDTTTVDSDGFNITADGFDLSLQEEEAQDGTHALESVGWIAIQPGGAGDFGTALSADGVDENTDTIGLGTTVENAVIIAKTQTMNGEDTAHVAINGQDDNSVGVFVMEESSLDGERDHEEETVGIVAFPSGLIEGTTSVPCFCTGTLIDTPSGPRLVEELDSGDLISLHEDGTNTKAPVLRVFRRPVSEQELRQHPCLRPIRIVSGALGSGLPRRDLLVSRQHKMLVSSQIAERITGSKDVLVAANKLTALPGIFQDNSTTKVTYFHVLLEDHQVIYAEGAPTESLFVGAHMLKCMSPAARKEIELLFPELECTPQVPARKVPPAAKQKTLISRHAANGHSVL